MTKIPLGDSGKFAIVDDEDFNLVSYKKWYLSTLGYAVTAYRERMHTTINKTPKGKLTDHINRDKLDNRKVNLRTANYKENIVNRGPHSNNKLGVKGVSFHKSTGKYRAQISVDGVVKHLGTFETIEGAKKAYNLSAQLYFKEFAYINREIG